MYDTRTADHYDLIPHRADGYRYSDGTMYRDDNLVTVRPSGGFISTISEMIKWDAAVSNLTLVSEDSRRTMWTPAILNDGTNTKYGFGWWIDEIDGVERIRHGGSNPGFRAWYTRYIDYNISVVVLANGWGARPHSIARDIAGFFIDELYFDRTEIALSVDDRRKFAGQYDGPDGYVLTIGIDEDGPSAQWGEWEPQEKLSPESPNSFFVHKDESYVFHSENDVVTMLVIEYGENQSVELLRKTD